MLTDETQGAVAPKSRVIKLNAFKFKKVEDAPPPFDLKEAVDLVDKLHGTLIRYSQAEEQRLKDLELKNLREMSCWLYTMVKEKQ